MNDDTDIGSFNLKCLCGISYRCLTSWTDSNLGSTFGVVIIIGDIGIMDFSDGLIPRCVQGRK
ncbi:hypothetical protein Ddye_000500 [Dipteronia dyeriana]|uniref:Uncharacterized protein n=1 Tax=Dipteronia dyeriana TaxID=168575 RepID=A0AAD9XMB6_9ROSI|nr:hypothetical protein Ddye_000500 [Dipteronia dyeriana]